MTVSQNNGVADLCIVGGGLIGLVSAIGLRQAGFTVSLIDQAPKEAFTPEKVSQKKDKNAPKDSDGRASALSFSSACLFKNLGLWDSLAPYAQPMQHIRIADGDIAGLGDESGSISSLFMDFTQADFPSSFADEEQEGEEKKAFGWIVENRIIRKALIEKIAADPGIQLYPATRVTGLSLPQNQELATLCFEDGNRQETQLVIAADGGQSPLRDLAAISCHQQDYDQTAMVCTVKHEHDHAGTAVELFLPGGPFAMLPMVDRRSHIVWSEQSRLAEKIIAMDDHDFMRELRHRFGDWLGDIELDSPRFSYPLRLSLANKMAAPRFALIGDAAHSLHPIAGQGFNLGLRDVAVLIDLLSEARTRGEDLSLVPHRYQQRRQFDVQSLSLICDRLVKLFSRQRSPRFLNLWPGDFAATRLARRLGLAGVGKIPPLKRLFVRHAMGLMTLPGSEQPPLLRADKAEKTL